jgi:hypothetical protein
MSEICMRNVTKVDIYRHGAIDNKCGPTELPSGLEQNNKMPFEFSG